MKAHTSVFINPGDGSSDNASMGPVSMSLYEVARSGARTRSNDSALLPADQASAYRADEVLPRLQADQAARQLSQKPLVKGWSRCLLQTVP